MSDTTAFEYAIMATIMFILAAIAIVWPLLGPLMPGIRRYHKTEELRYWHEWAVVENSGDIDSLHSFVWSAKWTAIGNSNRRVVSVAEAITKDTTRYAPRSVRIVNLPDIDKPEE
jgi:hypothetical protein